VDLDITKFFDHVNWDILMGKVGAAAGWEAKWQVGSFDPVMDSVKAEPMAGE